MNLLLTGAEGYLGSNFVEYFLKHTNYKIFCMSRNLIDKHCYGNRFVSIKQDMTMPFDSHVASYLNEIDYIVHLAGSSDVALTNACPMGAIRSNVFLTTNFLETVRANMKNLKKFLFFSSAEVFGASMENTLFKETDICNPSSIYAVTKYASQEICLAYHRAYSVPTVITNVMNIYGSDQPKSKFIPKIIDIISNDGTVSLHANNGPDVRNYLHVNDVASAVSFLLVNGKVGEKYNIASDEYLDNLEIAKKISKILNKELKYTCISSKKHHTLSLLDGSKLQRLGWSSGISMEEGLRRTIGGE